MLDKKRKEEKFSKEMSKIELMFLIILLGNVEKSVSTLSYDNSRTEIKIGERRRKRE